MGFRYELQPGTDIGNRCRRDVKKRDDARFQRAARRWANMRGIEVTFRVYVTYVCGTLAADSSVAFFSSDS
jgi:hypothetical protein